AYRRPALRPAWLQGLQEADLSTLPEPPDWGAALTALLASPTIACKRDIWRQYDHMLYLNTIVLPGSDAVVLRLKGHPGGLALSTDGNGRYCFLDPYVGGMIAVAEAARNVSCAGAEPVALTNCLNFGDPTRPEVMWQFGEVVRGMGEACRALGTPVTGGNVSFYNETLGRAIFPTPIVGMLGLLADIRHATTQWFKGAGDLVYLLGETRDELGGSEYITVLHGREEGRPPALDLGRERAVQETCRAAIRAGLTRSAHDTSEGGLAVALAECCIPVEGEPIGFTGTLPGSLRPEAAFFAESQSRIVISVRPEQAGALEGLARARGVPCTVLGTTGGATFTLTAGPATLRAEVAALAQAWRGGLRAAAGPGGDGRGA
ncbi:MAG TPA: AIR synthase related protein, partial [Candidatus Methylomirabilis sp.]|nr:AIR synthase related protein [Candidatus Methylomirabilis sp.]